MKKHLLVKTTVLILALLAPVLTASAQYTREVLQLAGSTDTFANIVFLGEGFTEGEMDAFEAAVREHADALFEKEPWKRYRKMFNIFYVKTPSNESGAGMTPDAPIDNFYGVTFGYAGVDRMPWPSKFSKVYEVLNATVPQYDMCCIIVNSTKYGGAGGGKFICYSLNTSALETLRHESGHSYGGLADEYWYRGREAPNMTQQTSPVRWQNWVGEEGVGVYAFDEDHTWYRPHQNCLMRYLNREYCAVCREALIERIHTTSQNILSYKPAESIPVSIDADDVVFRLDLLTPEPNSLRVDWMLDGTTIGAAHNKAAWTLKAADLSVGNHTLTACVEDTILLVRTVDHTTQHAATVTWNIEKTNSSGIHTTAAQADFDISPLPFSTKLTIGHRQPTSQPISAELIDMTGKQVAATNKPNGHMCTLATAGLPAGVYVLRIYLGQQLVYAGKVVKEQ